MIEAFREFFQVEYVFFVKLFLSQMCWLYMGVHCEKMIHLKNDAFAFALKHVLTMLFISLKVR